MEIPFDNLYKSMAITGVILFVLSLAYPPYFKHKTMPYGSIENLNKKTDDFDKKINIIDEKLTKLKKNKLDSISITIDEKGIIHIDSLNSRYYYSVFNELTSLKKETDELKTKSSEAIENYSLYFIIQKTSILLQVISQVLMAYGFFHWYNKVQIFQDLLLRKEAGQYVDTNVVSNEYDKRKISNKVFWRVTLIGTMVLTLIIQYFILNDKI